MEQEALQELLDRQAITQLIYSYCRSVDRLDKELGYSIWHEDGYADYGKSFYQGPGKGVIDRIIFLHRILACHSHQVSNVLINIDGNRAGSESYYQATLRLKLGGFVRQISVWGRYVDTWSKRDGRWGIDRRTTIIDFDEIRKTKSMSNPKLGRRDSSDPSYGVLALNEAVFSGND